MRKKAWLGLGGNIGDVQAAIRAALHNLDGHGAVEVVAVSPLYKTPPWGVEDQPWFFNCCAEVMTSLTPEELLAACQEQERLGKRERVQRWGPRTIDIDILVYEGVEQDNPGLALPHPRITERAFVLVPLADIAPQLEVQKRTVKDWA
ncbi:MAG: 2-amino-4-hydroxy-6-hydroxymethyldihydropteridine diphosphokinase, partial [Rhizobiaceae bacterium]